MCFGFDGAAAVRENLERQGREPRAMERRKFLGVAAGATAVGAIATAGLSGTAAASPIDRAAPGRRKVQPGRISIQLYTVRSDLANNYRRTVGYVADAGYRNVEQAGYYGMTARQVRRLHDNLGVQTTSSHDGLSANRDALETKLDNANVLGQKYVNVPYLNSPDPEQWRRWAWQINSEAYTAKQAGLAYGYHNHAHEFVALANGERPWDIFCRELEPSLVHFEADLCWVVAGGVQGGDGVEDPNGFAVETILASPLKVRQYHVKDRSEANDPVDLGTGMVEFDRIFAAHQVEEYVVENDSPEVSPQQTAEVGYDYLRAIRF